MDIIKNLIIVRITISISFQEVTPKRPVLMVISLAGIKVTCPQGQVRHINDRRRAGNRLQKFLYFIKPISNYNFIVPIIIIYDMNCANEIIKNRCSFSFSHLLFFT